MSYETTTGSRRTITAFFSSREDASEAVEALVNEGFAREDIGMVAGSEGEMNTTTTSHTRDEGGFWESLKDMFLPDEDRHAYAEGLRRGGYLVTLTTTSGDYERALDILDDEGTIDIGERENEWRSEGWSGYTGSDYPGSSASNTMGSSTTASTAVPAAGVGFGSTGVGATGATGTDYAATGREEVIPVAEEQIRVGKREVSQGRVRVRSYVVETPVNEQVSLREEHVNVERRPVDRALSGNEALFQDRTIEVEQTAEEAVISKDARVTEELVINKEVGQRTETISDTVRRTEVEVEDERGNVVGGTTGTNKNPL